MSKHSASEKTIQLVADVLDTRPGRWFRASWVAHRVKISQSHASKVLKHISEVYSGRYESVMRGQLIGGGSVRLFRRKPQ